MGYDYIFVGGGLACGLSALALLDAHPSLRIAIVEREDTLGGNHTWCFHAQDVPKQAQSWLAPLVVQRWDGYEVRFPNRKRTLHSPYACITSERLHSVVADRLAASSHTDLWLSKTASAIGAHHVTLDEVITLEGSVVIDARGPTLAQVSGGTGFQKFVGLELRVAEARGAAREPGIAERYPVLMDACMPQHDGLRFMYVLPLASDRVLIEETFFSELPTLNVHKSTEAILDYARSSGLEVLEMLRVETGVLPMPFDPPRMQCTQSPLIAGYRGGFFNPVTGYSFPLAIRFALALAESHPTPFAPSTALARLVREHTRQLSLLSALTRVMFTGFEPSQRFRVLEHFYRLPEPLVERFYAARLSLFDCLRLFAGAPPRGLSARRALGLSRTSSVETSP